MNHKKYLAIIGRKGGKAGTGEKKRRGDRNYYSRLGKLSAQKRLKKT